MTSVFWGLGNKKSFIQVFRTYPYWFILTVFICTKPGKSPDKERATGPFRLDGNERRCYVFAVRPLRMPTSLIRPTASYADQSDWPGRRLDIRKDKAAGGVV